MPDWRRKTPGKKSCLQTLENVGSLRSIIRLTGKDPNPENVLKVPDVQEGRLGNNKIIEMTCLDSTR